MFFLTSFVVKHDTKVVATKDQFLSCTKFSFVSGTVVFLLSKNNIPCCSFEFWDSVLVGLTKM